MRLRAPGLEAEPSQPRSWVLADRAPQTTQAILPMSAAGGMDLPTAGAASAEPGSATPGLCPLLSGCVPAEGLPCAPRSFLCSRCCPGAQSRERGEEAGGGPVLEAGTKPVALACVVASGQSQGRRAGLGSLWGRDSSRSQGEPRGTVPVAQPTAGGASGVADPGGCMADGRWDGGVGSTLESLP